jgi:hypothetical protein
MLTDAEKAELMEKGYSDSFIEKLEKIEETLVSYLTDCVFYYRHGTAVVKRRQAFLKAYGAVELADRLGLGAAERTAHYFQYIQAQMPKHGDVAHSLPRIPS